MPKIQELLEIISSPAHSKNYLTAMASGTCVICAQPSIEFRNEATRLEYKCSGICQACQDVYFSREKDRED